MCLQEGKVLASEESVALEIYLLPQGKSVQLIVCTERIENRTKHTNELCGQDAVCFNVEESGMRSYHFALKG
jgi:hypothetical protein